MHSRKHRGAKKDMRDRAGAWMRRMAGAVRRRWRVAAVGLLMTALGSLAMCRMRASEDDETPDADAGVLVEVHEALGATGTRRV